jgi:succinoglycan biosynthesis protein ExoM
VTTEQPIESTGNPPVVVAMLTYKRPADLAEAIPQILRHTAATTPPTTLMVVDNDPAGSAADAVAAFAADGVVYVNETTPGIAAARNRAIDEVAADTLLIFIDDDERPLDDWLTLMLATYQEYRSAAVVGPVISDYEVEPEEWIAAGRFFDRRRLRTGTAVDVAATNNLLLDLAQIHRFGLRFDEKFGQSGGSDTLFTRQLVRRGGQLIWCDEAIVIDKVPASRLTRRWVLHRAFRSGNSWTRTSLELAGSARQRLLVRLQTTGIGSLRLAGGLARAVRGLVTRSTGQRVRGIRTMARGAGMASGAFGYVYHEYRRKPAAVTAPAAEASSVSNAGVSNAGVSNTVAS